MTLKERLEAVWRDNRICSPCHINIWSETPIGYLRYNDLKLYWKHGKLLGLKKQKIKKGYSFLNKNYGSVYHHINRTHRQHIPVVNNNAHI